MCRCLAILLLLPVAVIAQEAKGTQYAFLVGCAGYAEKQLRPLPYTVNDVEQFRQALLETGFEADHVKSLHDKQERRLLPEKKKILTEFDILLDGLKPEDTVVVALSGHGVHFKKDATGYFCPLDADLKDKTTLIPFEGKDGLFDRLKACKAKRKLMIVNACRNDPTSDRAQAAEKIDLDDAAPEAVPEGIAAIYSCKPGQKSYYDPKKQAGIFFDHVTKAWRGEYAKGQDHTTIEDFFREVGLRTKADVDKVYGEAQVPEVKREYKEEWRMAVSQLAADSREYEALVTRTGNAIPWVKEVGPKRYAEWRRLADGGNVPAMVLTGRCFHAGAGVDEDGKAAFDWFNKAADAGSASGIYLVGVCYTMKIGVEADDKVMAAKYKQAVELGYPLAMSNLGMCYADGRGVKQDSGRAVEMFQSAADRGVAPAMHILGLHYFNGVGVNKDQKAAVELFRKAAKLGDKDAADMLRRLGEE